jgi:protein-S-isoprenylcysteine O-methyltransferase Ste14
MNAYRAKPLTYPWPPLLFGLAILSAFGLGRMAPIEMVHSHGWAPVIAGSILIAVAACLHVWAWRTLLDRHTTVLPHRCSTHLVTCGPYRFTRNPIYLGNTIMMAGIGLAVLNPWFMIMSAITVVVTTLFVIRNEELHLLSRFGFEFERYRRTTSRWI